ncbi:MAG: type I restriction endonuclease subunit R [Spirochaetales bacterium]|nr:type I restriction endonuclease subunit R [Spirochaetales bacterium]
MSPAGYTEDELVEQPAKELLAQLGWEIIDAYAEFDHGKSPLGRDTKSDVILTGRLRTALQKLNPDVPAEAITQVIDELTRDRSRMSAVAANREVYNIIKNGFRVRVPDRERDGETVITVRVIDWDEALNNDFLVCSQFWVTGEMYTRRADLIGFVNGLPLLFVELKAAHKRLEAAYNDNLRDYRDTVPHVFWPNAIIILSNGRESRMGSMSSGWEHFFEWKKIGSEKEHGRVSLETMLRGTCQPARFLDIVENFTIYQEVTGGLIKLVSKNHQYLGVNSALEALSDIRERAGKLGVFWHTQGSGKSISMIFFAQKVLRKVPGNWTFVVVTDRQELDRQIYTNFLAAGVVTENRAQAKSTAHLRQLLAEDHRYIFTLIHKFRTAPGEKHPVLSSRSDIIVITDEAHRSQYDTLALNMRTALPKAAFLAFTGTPLISGEEEKTRQVFGEYISIYNYKQSVLDKATVPLYYENRTPELQLVNKDLNEDMERLLEEVELDEDQEKRLEREFAREYHLITRDDRLEAIAKDLVTHFTGRGYQGKAMMICIDKATAVRMYEKVKKHWIDKISVLEKELETANADDKDYIRKVIDYMRETDMAVVVSQSQNEIADLKEKGIDIKVHRKRMVEEDLEKKFKDPQDPFRLVFVCAMWMTGFDVPVCSTLYLDKPMRNHTLMQTIARANRVFPGKVSGLIVDYVGVFRNLEKALAIYGEGIGGDKPVEDKSALLAALRETLEETKELCAENKVDLAAIDAASGFERVALMKDATEMLVSSDDSKRRFLDLANACIRFYKAVLPDQSAHEFSKELAPIQAIAHEIRSLSPVPDISQVMGDVEKLLDRSIATEGYIIRRANDPDDEPWLDLSAIDFDKLSEKFKQNRRHTINERLKYTVSNKLSAMVKLNRSRMDFMEKFQKMIEEYNAGTLNAEEFFERLKEFASSLDEEEQRGVKEHLNDEELALFDILTKPHIEMSSKDRSKVKAAARELLATLKEGKLVLDWRKRQQSRAEVQVTIGKILDKDLPEAVYSKVLYEEKYVAVYQHVYEAYYGAGKSIYTDTVA